MPASQRRRSQLRVRLRRSVCAPNQLSRESFAPDDADDADTLSEPGSPEGATPSQVPAKERRASRKQLLALLAWRRRGSERKLVNHKATVEVLADLQADQLESLQDDWIRVGGTRGLSMHRFIAVLRSRVAADARRRGVTDADIDRGLRELFMEIDFDGDLHITWNEFTSFLIDLGRSQMQYSRTAPDGDPIHHYTETALTIPVAEAGGSCEGIRQLLCFSEIGKVAAVARYDVRIHSVRDMRLLRTFTVGEAAVLSVAQVPLGLMGSIIVGCADLNFRLLNLHDWTERTLRSDEVSQTMLQWMPDVAACRGGSLVGGARDGSVGLYTLDAIANAEYQARLDAAPLHSLGEPPPTGGDAASPSAKARALSRRPRRRGGDIDGIARPAHATTMLRAEHVWRAPSGSGDVVTAGVGFPRDERFATGSLDGIVRLWDVEGWRPVRDLHGHKRGVNHLSFSPDFHLLASSGSESVPLLWCTNISLARPTMLRDDKNPHVGPLIGLHSVAGTPQLITGDECGIIKVWDLRMLSVVQTIHLDKSTMKARAAPVLTYIPSKRTIVAATTQFSIWEYVKSSNPLLHDDYPAVDVLYCHPRRMLVTAAAREVRLWDLRTGRLAEQWPGVGQSEVTAMALDPSCRKLFLGHHDGQLSVYNTANGLRIRNPRVASAEITGLSYLSQRNALLVSSWDRTVRLLHDRADARPIAIWKFHRAEVRCAAISPQLQLIASGDVRCTVCLWDPVALLGVGTLQPGSACSRGTFASGGILSLTQLPGDQEEDPSEAELTALTFLGGRPCLCTADSAGRLELWAVRPHHIPNSRVVTWSSRHQAPPPRTPETAKREREQQQKREEELRRSSLELAQSVMEEKHTAADALLDPDYDQALGRIERAELAAAGKISLESPPPPRSRPSGELPPVPAVAAPPPATEPPAAPILLPPLKAPSAVTGALQTARTRRAEIPLPGSGQGGPAVVLPPLTRAAAHSELDASAVVTSLSPASLCSRRSRLSAPSRRARHRQPPESELAESPTGSPASQFTGTATGIALRQQEAALTRLASETKLPAVTTFAYDPTSELLFAGDEQGEVTAWDLSEVFARARLRSTQYPRQSGSGDEGSGSPLARHAVEVHTDAVRRAGGWRVCQGPVRVLRWLSEPQCIAATAADCSVSMWNLDGRCLGWLRQSKAAPANWKLHAPSPRASLLATSPRERDKKCDHTLPELGQRRGIKWAAQDAAGDPASDTEDPFMLPSI
eukprot:TRINITY_DN47468_c0_g1_i1.p1 TRINITY_DN47468_c0_g1~~TRINITY_DN47468_c0_g1_i1.p1  ORF type:complete len:1272 (+),score=274.83 TRINITY_DN47468_c0_g1_i1:93-3818(+)